MPRSLKAVLAVVLFGFVGAASAARADVIVSGAVSTAGVTGFNCSESGTASSNLNLACAGTNPAASATVSGQGDAFSGRVTLDVGVLAPNMPPFGLAVGSVQLGMNQEYLLTAGSGAATVNFVVEQPFHFPTTEMSCAFMFNGASQMCDLGAGVVTLSEAVQYGVPFTVGLDLGINGLATNGEPEDGQITYEFVEPDLAAVPEPSSAWLLMPGLAAVMLAARSRGRGLRSFLSR